MCRGAGVRRGVEDAGVHQEHVVRDGGPGAPGGGDGPARPGDVQLQHDPDPHPKPASHRLRGTYCQLKYVRQRWAQQRS